MVLREKFQLNYDPEDMGWKWSSGCWQAAGGGFVFEGPE